MIPAVEVHDLTVSYARKPVLWTIDFEMPQGELGCILGPNGAGKSTLLKAILGLIDTQNGYVRILGNTLEEARRRISYVPQRESVDWDFPISVREVVEMGRFIPGKVFSRLTAKDKEAIDRAMERTGLTQLASRQISKLSGGQQQRVFIARSLAQDAEIYFMDEPFAGVDRSTEETLIQIMKEISNEGKTLLVVHHDLQTVPRYFSYTIMLNNRLIASGPVNDTYTAANLEKTFGGKLNVLTSIQEVIQSSGVPHRT